MLAGIRAAHCRNQAAVRLGNIRSARVRWRSFQRSEPFTRVDRPRAGFISRSCGCRCTAACAGAGTPAGSGPVSEVQSWRRTCWRVYRAGRNTKPAANWLTVCPHRHKWTRASRLLAHRKLTLLSTCPACQRSVSTGLLAIVATVRFSCVGDCTPNRVKGLASTSSSPLGPPATGCVGENVVRAVGNTLTNEWCWPRRQAGDPAA